MDRSDSTVVKGLAILLMLYWHLFYRMSDVGLCTVYLYISDLPFVNLFARCTNPVPFYLILSGYGLYRTYDSGRNTDKARKVCKLYINYWLTLAVFIPVCAYFYGFDRFPGSVRTFIGNVTALNTTYNGEIWFLFPYILIFLLSGHLSRFVSRYDWKIVVVLTGTIYTVVRFVLLTKGSCLHDLRLYYIPLHSLDFLFPVSLGMLFAKYGCVEKAKSYFAGRRLLCLIGLLSLLMVRMTLGFGFFHSLYAAVFILFFVSLPCSGLYRTVMLSLGRHSTTMWFTHSYFCYHLFHDFIYSFRYPAIIFAVLLVVSFLTAVMIDFMRDRLYDISYFKKIALPA